jgi:acyl-CoA thioester hydrolase
MEVGRINLLRDIELSFQQWERKGFHIPVVQAHANYKSSAKFDDEILAKTCIGAAGTSSIRFENEILKLPDLELLCTGHTVHALIDKRGRAVPIPADLKRQLTSS